MYTGVDIVNLTTMKEKAFKVSEASRPINDFVKSEFLIKSVFQHSYCAQNGFKCNSGRRFNVHIKVGPT